MSSPSAFRLGLAGSICVAAALMLSFFVPEAFGGWLAGFVFWSGLPFGAMVLVMMIRIIPGRWGEELGRPADAAMLLLPLALIAVLPVLAGLGALYPWAGETEHGFRGAYLARWSFMLRTALFFALTTGLALLLVLRRRWSVPISVAGLILFVLFDTAIAFDWLMSLDPEFHSSGFGLYVLSIQVTIALALLIPAHLNAAPGEEHRGVLGALLLCALLLWAYFAFMQFFIIWSTNLPHNVLWYQHRAAGWWSSVAYVIAALHALPALLLLFAPVRRGRQWLIGLSAAVLVGKALEACWLVLPDTSTGVASIAVAGLSLTGLGALWAAAFGEAQRMRDRIVADAAEGRATS
jgi:hypothetical protein